MPSLLEETLRSIQLTLSLEGLIAITDHISRALKSGAYPFEHDGEEALSNDTESVIDEAKRQMSESQSIWSTDWENDSFELPGIRWEVDRSPLPTSSKHRKSDSRQALALARLYGVDDRLPTVENLIWFRFEYPHLIHLIKAMDRVVGVEMARSPIGFKDTKQEKEYTTVRRFLTEITERLKLFSYEKRSSKRPVSDTILLLAARADQMAPSHSSRKRACSEQGELPVDKANGSGGESASKRFCS